MNMLQLGGEVKSERLRRGLGVRGLAALLATSPATISRLERGRETRGSVVLAVQELIAQNDDRMLTLPCAP